MGHQVIIYGMVEGASLGGQGSRGFRVQQAHNESVIDNLPTDDNWPWLTRAMFALPGSNPLGTYREQIIHFGLSIKDRPPISPNSAYDPEHGWPKADRKCVYGWIEKFEHLLRKLFWYGADVHVSTEFEPDRVFCYTPTKAAFDKMISENPQPIDEWELSITNIP